MFSKKIALLITTFYVFFSCKDNPLSTDTDTNQNENEITKVRSDNSPFFWNAATVYFMLTDRFHNGDTSNDMVLDRNKPTGKLRGFEGGDLKGIIQKIKDGYFEELGVNAIWFTPVVEQIHESVDEGTGNTYAYHGYWAKDWTAIDPNFGTMEDLKNLVTIAHNHGIRILLDVVLNHTGPVTPKDPAWPDAWIRTQPTCSYTNQETAVTCTLVKNLPDVKTESQEEVKLPGPLVAKWKKEGRLDKEMKELDQFFTTSGLVKSPKNYIIKWLTDYVRELGIDGYRVDTVKHVEEEVWKSLAEQAKIAFAYWKENHQDEVLDNSEFYLVGELYGYRLDNLELFNFGDTSVNFFDHGFDNLINFQFKEDASNLTYEELFTKYNALVLDSLSSNSVTNYLTSHDDGSPFDIDRKRTFEGGTKLLLSPGVAQIYYGDESARSLIIEDTQGDATLRSNMNWEDLTTNSDTKEIVTHWQKLGQFRKKHPAIGIGEHHKISDTPYTFSREYKKDGFVDKVVVALNLNKENNNIQTGTIFKEGTKVLDTYSGAMGIVKNNSVEINTDSSVVLLERLNK